MIVFNVPTVVTTEEQTTSQVIVPRCQWDTSYSNSIPGRLKIAAVVSEQIVE
jgi:hypothetical protein